MARRRLAAMFGVLQMINLRAVRPHTFRAVLAAFSLGAGAAVVIAVMVETHSVRTAVDDVGLQIAGPAPLREIGAQTRGGIGLCGRGNRPRCTRRLRGRAGYQGGDTATRRRS